MSVIDSDELPEDGIIITAKGPKDSRREQKRSPASLDKTTIAKCSYVLRN